MSDKMADLRAVLFETLRAVRSGEVDLDRARAVNELGKTLIDTAKVEVDYIRSVGGGESEFIERSQGQSALPPGITGIRQHRLKG
jgi:hypothetical protein